MERKLILTVFALLLVASFLFVSGPAMAEKKEPLKQFFGILIYRTGPYAPGGSGFGSGWEDFMQLRNMQGGVNGVMYEWEECETAYNTARGIACYERLKNKMALVQDPNTGQQVDGHPVLMRIPSNFEWVKVFDYQFWDYFATEGYEYYSDLIGY